MPRAGSDPGSWRWRPSPPGHPLFVHRHARLLHYLLGRRPPPLTRGEGYDGGESICPHATMGAQCRVIGLRVGSPALGLARSADRRPLQPPWLKEQTSGRTQSVREAGVSAAGPRGCRRPGAPMSKTAGVVLILGGLGLAAFAMSSEVAVNGSDPPRRAEGEKTTRVEASAIEDGAVPRPQPVLRRRAAADSKPGGSAPVVVTLAPRSGDAAASRTVAIPRDRDSLARELQKELRRVGCYEGELNGVWTPATRRAMKSFIDRVNATLPVDEPDAVLFAMVHGQQERVCGKPCPADQGLSEDGRCLPTAILAKAARKTSPTAVATNVPGGGPPAAGKSLPARSGWSATITSARPTPPAVGAPAASTPPQPVAATPLPTEGRMALAGPIDGPVATDPRLAAKPTAGSGNAGRTKPSQRGPHVVNTPRPRTFVSTMFRRVDSRL